MMGYEALSWSIHQEIERSEREALGDIWVYGADFFPSRRAIISMVQYQLFVAEENFQEEKETR